MTGGEFIRRVRRWAKAKGLAKPNFIASKGPGSHGTLSVDNQETTIKDRKKEIGPGLLHKMLADLKIDKDEFLRAGR